MLHAGTLAILLLLLAPPSTRAANCDVTSVGLTPLSELGDAAYLGFEGGLYPGGANGPPAAHAAEGVARANAVTPRATSGAPAAAGKTVLLSIGMSNTTQEYCHANAGMPCNAWTFSGQAVVHPDVDKGALMLANGAHGGRPAQSFADASSPEYDRIRDEVLAPVGLSEAQVQAVWIKQANPNPTVSLPDENSDARALEATLGDTVRAIATRYPNAAMVLLSNRIYAGYANSTLNPEPYAYESGFSVKWLIEAQIDQMNGGGIDPTAGDLDWTSVPWLGWGPDLWADGMTPRSDGLQYACLDLEIDGTHPAMTGEEKVGQQLLEFMLESPFTSPWFRAGGATAPPTLPALTGRATAALVLSISGIGCAALARSTRRRR
jgi:hypothetical protein